MLVMGIESSCDETAVAIVEKKKKNKGKIIKEIITTSISKLKKGLSILAKYNWLTFENKSTKAIFMKLFATRIAANNLLGLLSSFSINPFSLG